MEQAKNRKTYLDALRLIACLCVIYNHVSGQNMRLFSGVSGMLALGGLFFAKSAVALFLMISGAVLLNRCDSYKKTGMRVLRVLLALVLVSVLYYLTDCKEAPSFAAFLTKFLSAQIISSAWFLYLYLGILLLLPLLQKLTTRLTRRDYEYIILWVLLFSCLLLQFLIFIRPVLLMSSSFLLELFTVPVGLLLMGRYADVYMKMNGRRALLAVLLIVLLTVLPTAMTMLDDTRYVMLDNSFTPFAVLIAVCLFLLAKWMDARLTLSARQRNVISGAGKCTFCTYLIADFLIARLQFVREALVPALRTNGAGVAYTLFIFLVGLGVSAILTRVPVLRKIL